MWWKEMLRRLALTRYPPPGHRRQHRGGRHRRGLGQSRGHHRSPEWCQRRSVSVRTHPLAFRLVFFSIAIERVIPHVPYPHYRTSSPGRRSCLSLPSPDGADEATDRFLLSGQCQSGPGANKKKVGCLLQWGVCRISPFSELRFLAQSTALRFSNFPPNRGHELRETTPGQQASRGGFWRSVFLYTARPDLSAAVLPSSIDSSIELGQEDTYITHSIRFFFFL